MKVYKYHSCENVFLIVEYKNDIDFKNVSKKLCNELQADGLLVFKNDPMEMLVFNKDGSRAGMCGNGIRCLTNYIYNKYGIYKYLEIISNNFKYECQILNTNPFISSVALGIGDYYGDVIKKEININGKTFIVSAFILGVGHVVVISDDFSEDIKYIKKIFEHELFDKNFNVNLVKVIDNKTFEFITYERGVEFTKSCGTGAAACAYILHTEYMLDNNLVALCPGGVLRVDIDDVITLRGESIFINEYEINI